MLKSEKSRVKIELLGRMGRTNEILLLGHVRIKIFYVRSIPLLAAVAANKNLKEKRMTNVFRQLLMSTYGVHALLEAV